MKKIFLFTVISAVCAAFSLCAEQVAPAQYQPKKTLHRGKFSRNRFHKAHGIWVAFAELSAEERQAMLKLQREDPEKFRTEMHKLGEEFFKAEKARRKELADLVEQYKKADDKNKVELLEKIRTRVRDNFKRRLRQSRVQLDELQERAAKLEKELDRREKAEEKIVDAVVKNIISGRSKNFPHRRPAILNKAPSKVPLQAE